MLDKDDKGDVGFVLLLDKEGLSPGFAQIAGKLS